MVRFISEGSTEISVKGSKNKRKERIKVEKWREAPLEEKNVD